MCSIIQKHLEGAGQGDGNGHRHSAPPDRGFLSAPSTYAVTFAPLPSTCASYLFDHPGYMDVPRGAPTVDSLDELAGWWKQVGRQAGVCADIRFDMVRSRGNSATT